MGLVIQNKNRLMVREYKCPTTFKGSPGLPSLNKTLQEPLNTPNATDYFEMTDEDLTWICKQLF